MSINSEISSRIVSVRIKNNESQSAFARSLNIPRSTLVGYEKGSTIPAHILSIIAQKYNVSESWLLSGGKEELQTQPANVKILTKDKPTSWLNNIANATKEELQTQPFSISNEMTKRQEANQLMSKLSEQKGEKLTNSSENLPKNKHTSMLNIVSNGTKESITDYASAIEELLKPLIIKIHGKETPPSQKALELIEELSQVLAEPPNEKAPKLDKRTEDRLEEMAIEMANMKKDMERLALKFDQPPHIPQSHEEPEELKEYAPEYTASPELEEEEETTNLPLAENLAAGIPLEAYDTGEYRKVPSRYLKKGRRYCVAQINGTSMVEAGIPDGSYVLLEYTDKPVDGSIMVVTHDGHTTLKRLHESKDGTWELLYEDGSRSRIELIDGQWEVKGAFIRVL